MKHLKIGLFILVLAFTPLTLLISPVHAQEKTYTLAPKSDSAKSSLYHKKEGAKGRISVMVFSPGDDDRNGGGDRDLFVVVWDKMITDKSRKALGSDYLNCSVFVEESSEAPCAAAVTFTVPSNGTYYVYVYNNSNIEKEYSLTSTQEK